MAEIAIALLAEPQGAVPLPVAGLLPVAGPLPSRSDHAALLANRKWNHRSQEVTLQEAADLLQVPYVEKDKAKMAKLLTLVRALLVGTKVVDASLEEEDIVLLRRLLPLEADKVVALTELAQFFLSKAQIVALLPSAFVAASEPSIRFWADACGVPVVSVADARTLLAGLAGNFSFCCVSQPICLGVCGLLVQLVCL